ncbi:MAG: hypothetical protein FDZ69_12340 [Deltaproteobacteria bacterium]|nr:MAG: hypothetical protein FDZ69_12340 [Deltaproteobacteria bacterium]
MITIRSPGDIERARLPPHLVAPVTKHLQHILDAYPAYDSDDHGHLILVTPSDTDAKLGQQLGRRWGENGFEGVEYDAAHRCFVAVVLRNNEHAITILVPDEPWLDPDIRQRLLLELAGDAQPAPLPDR